MLITNQINVKLQLYLVIQKKNKGKTCYKIVYRGCDLASGNSLN